MLISDYRNKGEAKRSTEKSPRRADEAHNTKDAFNYLKRKADYALKNNHKPVLFIEAKPLNDTLKDVKSIAQIVSYAARFYHNLDYQYCRSAKNVMRTFSKEKFISRYSIRV